MKSVVYRLCLLFLPLLLYSGKIRHEDFDLLMDLDRYKTVKFFSNEDKKELKFYEKNYLEKCPLLLKREALSNIPKTIHFIWLGPKEFPKESIKNLISWKKHHPDWVIKYWTDDPSRALPIEGLEKQSIANFQWSFVGDLYQKTENWGEKSDLLRYEILFKEGGLYVDHDIECFRPFDQLSCYDFYVVLEPPHYNPGITVAIFPTNGLIASRPDHPILKAALGKIGQEWNETEKKFPGPKFTFVRVLNRTFISFLKAVREHLDQNPYSIALPATFLYPPEAISIEEKTRRIEEGLSFGHHLYAGTWN